MKIIIKRTAFILMSLLLICSLTFNVIQLISNNHNSDYTKGDYQNLEIANGIISINDSYSDRLVIYDTAFNTIANSNNVTIHNKNMQGLSNYVKETITCAINEEGTNYRCKMSSTLYDLNNNVVRTSYFPGDGYKYTLEGINKSKTTYSSESLETYFLSLINGAVYYLSYLSYDSTTVAGLNFSTYMNFDYKSLIDLTKEINVTYSTLDFNLCFDKYDTLTKLEIGSSMSLDISYDSVDLQFPSFEGYTE